MRHWLIGVVLGFVPFQLLAQTVGDHATNGFTNNRTFLNSEIGDLAPPLELFSTVSLTGVTSADILLVFGNAGAKYLLVGEGRPDAINYHLFDRTKEAPPALWTRSFSPGPLAGLRLTYTPAYSNGIVLLGGAAQSVRAVRVADGAQLWTDDGVFSPVSPVLTPNLALYGGLNRIVAANPTTGAPFWQSSVTAAQPGVSLALEGDRLYVPSSGDILAFSVFDGTDPDPSFSAPVLSNGESANVIPVGQYVFFSDPKSATGTVGAVLASNGGSAWNSVSLGQNPTLALGYDRLFVFFEDLCEGDQTCPTVYALDPDARSVLWQRQDHLATGNTQPPAKGARSAVNGVIGNNVVYYYDQLNQSVRARDAFTGTLLWSAKKSGVRALSLADESLFLLFSNRVEIYKRSEELFLAHFADGTAAADTQTTLIALTNPEPPTLAGPAPPAAQGTIHFLDQNGAPIAVRLRGQQQSVTTLDFAVPAGASFQAESLGEGDLKSGWISVTANRPLRGTSIFRLGTNQDVLYEAGVAANLPADEIFVFAGVSPLVEGSRIFNTGVAIVNPSLDEVAETTLELLSPSGVSLAVDTLSLEPRSHEAKFATELFDTYFSGHPEEFSGSIRVSSRIPVVVTALRTKNGRQASSYPAGAASR